ncbi:MULTISPECIES: sugar dehydrogenase complex small subunit [Thioclava]|uniref:Sugar dehydrogenase complex small subunit n=1 Tax=Thioclava litoralis TaxID=3076557 RepID=A0ABZ1E6U5_9RHOB|nr:sugar dehydrogenase complex small subunit [Thioclava sp. FTW29]
MISSLYERTGHEADGAASGRLTRRRLLGSATAMLAAAAMPAAVGAAVTQPLDADGFTRLSQLLTGRETLSPVVGARALAALSQDDDAFAAQAAELAQAIEAAGFSDMRQFNSFAEANPALRPVAMKIISAWYLGYTGTPSMNTTKDDAQFVSYAEALMYEPTRDATVIPSWSRGHSNYWKNPPAFMTGK